MIHVRDIIPVEHFQRERPARLARILALKKERRFTVGPHVTVYPENRETLLWQIQEMLRVERSDIYEDEIAAYAPLVPMRHSDGSREISITLMIDILDPKERGPFLRRALGMEHHITLDLGDASVSASSLNWPDESDKTTSVHFLKFILNASQVNLFQKKEPIFKIHHPYYTEHAIWPKMSYRSVLGDLCAE